MKSAESRDEVLARYGNLCAKCRKEETKKDKITLHHIVFKFWYRSHGIEVDNSPENLAPLHRSCHTEYHDDYERTHKVSRLPRTSPESLRETFETWRSDTSIALSKRTRGSR